MNRSRFGGQVRRTRFHTSHTEDLPPQSAGAGSVEAHFVFPASESFPLFRAGIADSSTGPLFVNLYDFLPLYTFSNLPYSKDSPDASTYDRPGRPFDMLLTQTGCAAVQDLWSV